MKQTINSYLPDDKGELSYIVNNVGQRLFKNDWDLFKPSQLVEEKINTRIITIIDIINKTFTNEQHIELINYLFSESLNKLVGN